MRLCSCVFLVFVRLSALGDLEFSRREFVFLPPAFVAQYVATFCEFEIAFEGRVNAFRMCAKCALNVL